MQIVHVDSTIKTITWLTHTHINLEVIGLLEFDLKTDDYGERVKNFIKLCRYGITICIFERFLLLFLKIIDIQKICNTIIRK